ncbi:MAG TPA: TraB/GumN family protein [Stellaceae bacterium]|nr:TraB/GumN family protein [Stellaceae bacterium]
MIGNLGKILRNAVIVLIAASASATAEPGLWVVEGPHATVYLFGTIHVLHKDQAWSSPDIAKALGSSQELWLEVSDPDDLTEVQALVKRYGFDQQHPLSTKVSEADLAHVDEAAKSVGVADGEKTFEPMRPWLVSVTLADAMLIRAGYDPESGVEHLLLHDDLTHGKPVHGFETLDQQIHFFADLAPALEVSLLKDALKDFDQGAGKLDALVDAWSRGDDAAITRLVVDDMKTPFPQLYRTLFVQRNERWVNAITAMIKGSGVKFIAVGAGHLAGPDSVQNALKRRGVRVERVAATN